MLDELEFDVWRLRFKATVLVGWGSFDSWSLLHNWIDSSAVQAHDFFQTNYPKIAKFFFFL